MIDLHSHILPNLDDGAEDMDVALDMLTIAQEDGIRHLVATPHFIPGSFAPSGLLVRASVDRLQEAANARGLDVKLSPGHEVRAGTGLVQRLRSGEILALDPQGRYLLVELPGSQVPEWIDRLIFELQVAGIVPVLAHPERNMGIIRNPMRLHALIEKGCRTQITAGSFFGHFGSHVAEVTAALLEHDMVHLVASDAHDNHFRTPVLSAARREVAERQGEERAREIFSTNPEAILAGNDFETPEPSVIEDEEAASLFTRFLKFFRRHQ